MYAHFLFQIGLTYPLAAKINQGYIFEGEHISNLVSYFSLTLVKSPYKFQDTTLWPSNSTVILYLYPYKYWPLVVLLIVYLVLMVDWFHARLYFLSVGSCLYLLAAICIPSGLQSGPGTCTWCKCCPACCVTPLERVHSIHFQISSGWDDQACSCT